MKPKLFILAALILLPASLQAALVKGYEFNTDGDQQGFVAPSTSGLTVANGFISGTAVPAGPTLEAGDPQLVLNSTPVLFSKATSETWTTLIFRVREFDALGIVVTSFDSAGIAILLGSNTGYTGSAAAKFSAVPANFTAVSDGPEFFTVSVDISGFSQNNVKYLRVDPIGGPDAASHTFDVDYIRVSDSSVVPEPSVSLLGALGCLALLRRRR